MQKREYEGAVDMMMVEEIVWGETAHFFTI